MMFSACITANNDAFLDFFTSTREVAQGDLKAEKAEVSIVPTNPKSDKISDGLHVLVTTT